MVYRPEIDGLRAISVLTVIFFHAGLAGRCKIHTGVDLLYYDDDHLSLQGAERLMRLIEPVLVDLYPHNTGSREVLK